VGDGWIGEIETLVDYACGRGDFKLFGAVMDDDMVFKAIY
jgi:hypothetical protein